MKMDTLPKVFAAAFIVIFMVMFQYNISTNGPSSLIGGFLRTTRNIMSGLRKELPPTSIQLADAPSSVGYLPMAVFSDVELALPTLTPTTVVVDESILAFQTPEFYELVASVSNGDASVARGLYVPGVVSSAIIQQPKNEWSFVSEDPNLVTQFQSASTNGVTGLLAHNYLLGEQFYAIDTGQYLAIIYGDGSIRRYQVTGIYQFQKLNQSSLTSDFINLQTGERESSTTVFNRFYTGGEKVTLQTCLLRDGQPSWGLTFFVAEPLP